MTIGMRIEKCTAFVLPICDLSDFQGFLRKSGIEVKTLAAIDFPCVVGKIEYDYCGGCIRGFG